MEKIMMVSDLKYIDEMTELYSLVFKRAIYKDYLIQKHFQNPCLGKAPAAISLDGERVIGATYFMSGEHIFENKLLKSFLACDYMVHPDYRRKGLSTKMTEAGERFYRETGYDFAVAFPNYESKQSLINNEWKEFWSFDYYVLPCFGFKFFQDITTFSKAYKINQMWKQNLIVERSETNPLGKEDYDKLNKQSDKIRSLRTEDYFLWKTQNTDYEHFFITVSDSNSLLLFILVRIDIRRVKGLNLKFLDLIDWHFISDNTETNKGAFSIALDEIRKFGDSIVIWEPSDKLEKDIILNNYGFYNMTNLNLGKYRHYMLGKILNKDLPDKILNSEYWKTRWIEADI